MAPAQRPTEYLLHPDPNDPYYRQSPGGFIAEFNDRVTAPLYGLIFALVPLLFIGQAQSHRMSRAPSVTMASTFLILLRGFAFFMVYTAPGSAWGTTVMYGLPIVVLTGTVVLVLRGKQIRPPERMLAAIDRFFGRIGGLFRRRTEAAAGT
jgi:lipopolysaccharide export system permease protein